MQELIRVLSDWMHTPVDSDCVPKSVVLRRASWVNRGARIVELTKAGSWANAQLVRGDRGGLSAVTHWRASLPVSVPLPSGGAVEDPARPAEDQDRRPSAQRYQAWHAAGEL